MECCVSEQQWIVSTGPGALPVHRNDIKRHARLGFDVDEEDTLIDQYIAEATEALERDTERALVYQTRKLFLTSFPHGYESGISLPGCPVRAVSSITYTDYNGDVQTWSSNSYQVNTSSEPCMVRYVYGGLWPSAREQEKSITITYKAGYIVPFSVNPTTNVLTVTGYTPTNGDCWRVTNSGGMLPGGLSQMTDYYVIASSGSTCKLSTSSGGSEVDITTTGTGLNFLGELDPRTRKAIYLRVAASLVDREGADHGKMIEGYWSQVYSLRYRGW